MCDLTKPIYSDPDKAREHLEAIRWPNGPVCPHCGVVDSAIRLNGKSHRPGLLKCKDCREQFSVTVGTVFERSKVPLNKWILAAHLVASSKKGISAHQLHRTIGVTYKTAWFMMHRLREAMGSADTSPMGAGGGTVEVDETYIGRKPGTKKRRGYAHKNTVVTLVERGGKARSFHVAGNQFDEIRQCVKGVSSEASLMTDEAHAYKVLGKRFVYHGVVNHSHGEYVRGTDYTNTIENFFSVFKRGMKGVYQHCSSQHLQRYLNEFDFRYNHRSALGVEDVERAEVLLSGIAGKRLTYRRPDAAT